MLYEFLDTPVEYLKGVGPVRGDLLKKELGIFTFYDLLQYYPFRYIDKSKIHKISEISTDLAYVFLKGKIQNVEVVGTGRARRLSATLYDQSGKLDLVWFKGLKWVQDRFQPDIEYLVFGKPSVFNNRFNIAHPEVEEFIAGELAFNEKFTGVYSSTEKLKERALGSKGLQKLIKTLLGKCKDNIPECLSNDLIRKYNFISKEQSLFNVHFPESPEMLEMAQKRLKFEELFFIQLRLLKQKKLRNTHTKGFVFTTVGYYLNTFFKEFLPFELTSDQKQVLKEIRADMGSGKHMNRLLQGDVGSGKTLVALMAMLIALDNQYQACFMAPTEILAGQHYNTFIKMLNRLDVRVALLTGSTKSKERKVIHENLRNGSLQILIGTHALLEDDVIFNNLGLVIIDEQHRFGVAQRANMWKKNHLPPHVLVMTATPIPRTLAMTVYGDLDVSVIRTLPPGRKPVKTFHAYDSARLRVFGFMKKQISAGRQIYVVYPLIQESSKLDLKDLMDGYESITREFPLPEYAVSIVHGQMKPDDKEYEMQGFVAGRTQIMVATTVIEVGVDVPNASVMIIENAERFGLSQLHQLRGRVGRGADQSYCILMTNDKLSNEARVRIETMVNTNDGFLIAETDLKLRGPGDIEGTRQSGLLQLRLADLVKDEKMLIVARNNAMEILQSDPQLKAGDHTRMDNYLKFTSKYQSNWSRIS